MSCKFFFKHVGIEPSEPITAGTTETRIDHILVSWDTKNVVNESFCGACSNFTWLYTPTCLKKNLQLTSIYYPCLILKLQKNVLLFSCHMLRRFVTEH